MWPFKKRAAPTKAARRAPMLKRNMFNAAKVGDNLNYSWGSNPTTPDALVRHNLRTLRARSREQAANNDYVRQFIGMVCDNVIGANGIKVQSKAIGRNGDADPAARQAIEREWNRWKKQADITGQMHFADMERLIVAALAGDGELLVRKHTSGPYGLQLELIDPEQLNVDYCQQYRGNPVVFGIEYDSRGRRVAYHIKSRREDKHAYQTTYLNGFYRRVPADQMFHLYVVERVGQRRGIPWTATGLQRLKMLSAFEDAEVVGRRLSASKMGLFKSPDNERYQGDGTDDDGAPIMDVEAGTFENIGRLEFEAIDWKHDGTDYADFRKAALRGIASGLRISYNTLANDLSDVNYSSMRHGAINEREVWIGVQQWLIRNFMQPLFEEWLELQHTLRTISIPMGNNGQLKPLSRPIGNYLPTVYQARRWMWVDPLKELQAKKLEIEAGLISPQAVIREMGRDVEEVLDELAEWQQLLDERGIQLAQPSQTPSNEVPNGPEQTDE